MRVESLLRISVVDNGVAVNVKCPIIGNYISKYNSFRENCKKTILGEKSDVVDFNTAVAFLASDSESQKSVANNFVSYNTQVQLLTQYTDIFKSNPVFKNFNSRYRLSIDLDTQLLYKSHININCICNSEIKNGKTFVYNGVYNSELLADIKSVLLNLIIKKQQNIISNKK